MGVDLGGTIVGIDDLSMVSSALKHRHWMFFDRLTFMVFGWFSDFRGQWSNEKLKFSLKSSKTEGILQTIIQCGLI